MTKTHVIDFESFWSDTYTLNKLTTEEYIRHPDFRTHLVGMLETDGKRVLHQEWVPHEKVQQALDARELHKHAVVAHHAQFDGLILSHHYGIKPKIWFDTLSMARPIDGWFTRVGMTSLAKYHNLPEKQAAGDTSTTKNIRVLSPQLMRNHGSYCLGDCHNTFWLFKHYANQLNRTELRTIDSVVRMFTEPELILDAQVLEEEIKYLKAMKVNLLLDANVTPAELRSSAKFAEVLVRYDERPRVKTTKAGNKAYAFAKNDEYMQYLLEKHPDPRIQALAAARLGIMSTMAEARAQRLLEMSTRGKACVYINYWGAQQTGRHSGGDKTNWQNLQKKSRLREAVLAPEGQELAVADESQIEYRTLITLAGQWDAVQRIIDYDNGRGEDPYCYLATRIYGRHITPDDTDERQLGKIATLGLGYKMSGVTFISAARAFNVVVPVDLAKRSVDTYRSTYDAVVQLWNKAQRMVELMMVKGLKPVSLDAEGLIWIEHEAVRLPNGMYLRYPNLHTRLVDGQTQHVFLLQGKKVKVLYGGKLIENIVQALARLIMMEATARVSPYYPIRLHSHDELGILINPQDREEVKRYLTHEMKRQLGWWPRLPLASKTTFGINYKAAK